MSLILPEQRAIFLHIPKCAGQSIERALGIQHHHRHHKLNDLPEDWPSYFRFTFVRHPVSRFISACRYNLHVARSTRRQLEQSAQSELSPTKRFRLHLLRESPDISSIVNDLSLGRLKPLMTFQPQERWLRRGRPQFIGRVEHLDQDFTLLQQFLGTNSQLVHTNRSKDHSSLGNLSAHDLNRVFDYYKLDFIMTGYPQESPDT